MWQTVLVCRCHGLQHARGAAGAAAERGIVLGYFPLLFRLWLFQIVFPTATRKRWKRPFTAAVVLMLYLRLYAAVADKEILLLFTLLYLKKFLCYTINREDILIYLLLGIF